MALYDDEFGRAAMRVELTKKMAEVTPRTGDLQYDCNHYYRLVKSMNDDELVSTYKRYCSMKPVKEMEVIVYGQRS